MTGNASIFFAPDGYETGRARLMGRHTAGEGFLRALVQTAGASEVSACVASDGAGNRFRELVAGVDPAARVETFGIAQLGKVRATGTLYLPGPDLAHWACLRDADDARAYSLCGVTHTISSTGAVGHIQDFLSAPVAPWDALVCTSRVVRESVDKLLNEREEFLRQRLGIAAERGSAPRPQLPVIPLGVDSERYAPNPAARQAWREKLGIAADAVTFIFVGRLSFHAKAHPLSMFQVLEAVARSLPVGAPRIHLILAGWFANGDIEAAFLRGAQDFAPSVAVHVVDARETQNRYSIWSAADAFLSLSDNYQETFGLTPIEAMACGLPAVVSDWNGYRDTVLHGETGFRIPTVALPPGGLDDIAQAHAAGVLNYDQYLAHTCQTVAVDLAECTKSCRALVLDGDLRARLGAAGRKRAQEVYDWKRVLGRYRELWAELARLRPAKGVAAKKRRHFPDPTALFGNYPSATWLATDLVAANPDISDNDVLNMSNHPLWANGQGSLIGVRDTLRVIAHLQANAQSTPVSIRELVRNFSDLRPHSLLRTVAWLYKWGAVSRIPSRGSPATGNR